MIETQEYDVVSSQVQKTPDSSQETPYYLFVCFLFFFGNASTDAVIQTGPGVKTTPARLSTERQDEQVEQEDHLNACFQIPRKRKADVTGREKRRENKKKPQ